MRDPEALAVVVVTHNSAAHIADLCRDLLAQMREADELLVVDNASADGTVERARSAGSRVRVLADGRNEGFAAGCHEGAAASRAPLLLFLNPDCRVGPDLLDALRAGPAGWAAWQAVVTLPGGKINSAGGVVHFLGMGWARDCERDLATLAEHPYETPFPSGAAMVVRRSEWERTGGLEPSYFLYGEDLDLGLRLWLGGGRVGVLPGARVEHDYEFDKGPGKWFYLERNRWRTILAAYPASLLVLLAPALLAAELALLLLAARQGWLAAKLRAQLAVLRGLPETIRRRAAVQDARRQSARSFAALLEASLDSPYLGAVSSLPLVGTLQSLYWRGVLALLPR